MFRRERSDAKFKRILTIVTIALAIVGNAKADYDFGTPVNLGPTVNSSANDAAPSVSSDGLSLFFTSNRSGGHGGLDIWVASRATIDDDWGAPVNLGSMVNSSSNDGTTSISADGLTLYFSSGRSGGYGNDDLWIVTRETTDDKWGAPRNLGPTVNGSYIDWSPSISADGLELFMHSNRPSAYGGDELWVARRETTDDDWGSPVNLGPTVNSPSLDATPRISADGLMLFFQSTRPGGYGGVDIWMTRRTTTDDDWSTPVNLGPSVNTSDNDLNPDISFDGATLYFCSGASGGSGGSDLWQSPIIPIVDFNGDDVVNAEDMSIMVHYWGTNEPLCDIGPMPWGDGVVDVQDLIVLAGHFGPNLELAAHWKLDESGGTVAHNSIGGSGATVVGGATWQPDGGLIDGALKLDGVDDHVATDFVLDPKVGPVRVVCWVKTDVAGGVIASQTPGAAFGSTWLATDPADGTLLSEMMFPLPALHSTYVVADGQWHEVTAEWDGTYRRLWADNQEVAKDALPTTLPPFSWNGTLIVGAGPNLEPGAFFTGLIDDVRIYNRAVRP